jgi:3-hydroxyacyl-CoA dehydrogenase
MQNRAIRKLAVLGSGVMGSRIACHFAGAGISVLLLDMIPEGVDVSAPVHARNKLVNDALAAALASNPSPIYIVDARKKITTGNFTDNLPEIAECDWVIEVVVERLDIKKQLLEQVDALRKPGTLITTNTSGIPIHLMAEGRSDDFKKHFCGTHFFNPPRYLRLLEIIPTPHTDPAVIDFLVRYGDVVLGKTTVLCKDTPAFIANRIGVYAMMTVMQVMEKLQLGIDEVDALTGPVAGRPKSATFRTADVVGIDTLVKVARGVAENCPDDEDKPTFDLPEWLQSMVEKKWLGDKTGQGFFIKTKGSDGSKEIKTLNLATLQYEPRRKPSFRTLEEAKSVDNLADRLRLLFAGTDKAGEFHRMFHYRLFAYISHRIPEISNELYRIDDALQAGFGWEAGAFESWDILGLLPVSKAMKAAGHKVADWVDEMIAAGHASFYKIESGKRLYYDVNTRDYLPVPGASECMVMRNHSDSRIWKNSACSVYHLGDAVLGLEWNTKMGSIGGEVLEGIQRAISLAESDYKGLVIANEGPQFSAGANVAMIFMLAIEQEYDEIDMAVRLFQQTMMRARYSSVPVVVAPHGLTLGGACELSLHADKVVAAAETYIGLVEAGIGVIPGGGGTKEFVLRASDELHAGEVDINTIMNRFLTIATAKVATSAHEAFEMGVLRRGTDAICMNQSRRIDMAKKSVLSLYDAGYVMPVRRNDIRVLGRGALGTMLAGIHGMYRAKRATEHDVVVAKKLAYVMCGGDLSQPATVSEQYLLDLEREAFLSLCGEKKTLERMQHTLKTGKPLRN